MVMRKAVLIIIFFAVIVISGCVQQAPEKDVEKTALLSFTEFFCYGTEWSEPHAFFQFAYQEDGQIKYVKTKTTCEDLIKINATNDESKSPTFGEQIKLRLEGEKPVQITRENGEVYDVKESEQIRSFFTSGINVYDNLKYFRNSNSDKIIAECSLLTENNQHDRCLSYQAAFLTNETLCDDMKIISNQESCKQWIRNIEEGKINN